MLSDTHLFYKAMREAKPEAMENSSRHWKKLMQLAEHALNNGHFSSARIDVLVVQFRLTKRVKLQ